MKIITIAGKSCSGKTTISHELAKVLGNYMFVDIWKIKEIFEPYNAKNRKLSNQICKEVVFSIIKNSAKQRIAKNFILQEARGSTVRKYLKNNLKKEDKIYPIFLEINLDTALKRNISRDKKTIDRKHFIKQAKKDLPRKEKGDIVINTENKSIKKVIDEILKTTGEKRTKKKIKIRRCV